MAQITCRFCGTVLESNRPGQARCNADGCRRAYMRDAMTRSRAKAAASQPAKQCRECGTAFGTVAEVGNRQYCSPECARAHHLRHRRDTEYAPAILSCDHCGGEIPYKSGKRRYCSADCQKAGIAKEAKWRVKGLPPSIQVSTTCELCGTADRRLVIDHDHACCPQGKACGQCFRGMLCQPCNVALGMLQESPDLLCRAAEYIEHHRDRQLAI